MERKSLIIDGVTVFADAIESIEVETLDEESWDAKIYVLVTTKSGRQYREWCHDFADQKDKFKAIKEAAT